MRVRNWFKLFFVLFAAAFSIGPALHLFADEELPKLKKKRVVVIETDEDDSVVENAKKAFWIGIHCEVLNSGVAVKEVVEGSPAEKGGVETGDILNRVGGTEIDDVKSLVESIQKSRGKAISLEVTRGEDVVTLSVTPEEKPQFNFPSRKSGLLGKADIADFFSNDEDFDFRFVNPGMILDFDGMTIFPDFPNNANIKVERKNDEKAKITIERDGKEWNVTEENLDELPKDLRAWAEKILKAPKFPAPIRNRSFVPRPMGIDVEELKKQFRVFEQPKNKAQDKQILELKKEIRELRKMIEELKE